ncbi:hypothetical protein C4L39_25715 [Clostridium diolis]|nr:hypothetical protein C4L39_25715 [Clostridium diolis]
MNQEEYLEKGLRHFFRDEDDRKRHRTGCAGPGPGAGRKPTGRQRNPPVRTGHAAPGGYRGAARASPDQ